LIFLTLPLQNKKMRSVSAFNNELKLRGFNVFQIESDGNATRIYSRKDFYKIKKQRICAKRSKER